MTDGFLDIDTRTQIPRYVYCHITLNNTLDNANIRRQVVQLRNAEESYRKHGSSGGKDHLH
ncbi:hypothetical protein BBBOND_0212230 [Babesia bigemina]|uniref:Uncharacterized protein n=1 Tax=Babesia bigemina TaxID=5866 RepID=A0A061D5T6_BABBI|nr:hypothetical protein BBBOND_0212230 [Babesia bigemina]CDR96081.1 hypothetical protein BBBOND_0212230 [Babesia bigemina]|eukprot:XP_012768267.1 hypothetical protein BBBOND_0212230 [Babesia bigemina]